MKFKILAGIVSVLIGTTYYYKSDISGLQPSDVQEKIIEYNKEVVAYEDEMFVDEEGNEVDIEETFKRIKKEYKAAIKNKSIKNCFKRLKALEFGQHSFRKLHNIPNRKLEYKKRCNRLDLEFVEGLEAREIISEQEIDAAKQLRQVKKNIRRAIKDYECETLTGYTKVLCEFNKL